MLLKEIGHSKIGLYEIGPDEARELLLMNTNNRDPSANNVAFLASEMTRGAFDPFASIHVKISRNNVMLDGQHFCYAVIACGLTVKVRIEFGLDPALFEKIDTGRSRTLGDLIHNRYASQVVNSACDLVLGKRVKLSVSAFREHISIMPESWDYAISLYRTGRKTLPRQSAFYVAIAQSHSINEAGTKSFMESMKSDTPHPIATKCKELFLANRNKGCSGGMRRALYMRAISCLGHYFQGDETLHVVRAVDWSYFKMAPKWPVKNA